jgi:hypothetical protein
LNNKNKILLSSLIFLLGFTFWRNYGVKPKGVVILDNENKTLKIKNKLNKSINNINSKKINKLNHKSNILYNCNDKNIITLEFEDNDGWFNISEIKISIPLNILEKYIKMGYDECKNKLS